ncbi:MAG: sulfatase [Sedimentisphaerales bacterium]|nr:sulfatase [Sedimentisphaerales bacterium]
MDTKQNKLENGNAGARFGLLDMLHFIIWFSVLSGLVEVTLPQMNELIGGRTVFLHCHTIWMSPLANVVVIGIVSLILLPLLLRLPRSIAVRISFIVLASIVFLNILNLEFARLSRIHFVAKVVLAIGLAVVLQRFIAPRTSGFERFVRRSTIGLILLVLVLTLSISSHRHLRERGIITALNDSPPSAPNVLLIVLDTVRAESMSLYGYERSTTPYLTALAREGIVFQNAIATSSWTLPSHVSIFTGRFRYETAADYSKLGPKYATLAEFLSKRGYITGGFVANTRVCSRESGLARGFIHYEDYVASLKEFVRSSPIIRFTLVHRGIRRLLGYYENLHHIPASLISKNFLSWIEHVPSDLPFFAFLNYIDAHIPYLPPAKFAEKFGPIDELEKIRKRGLPEGEKLGSTEISQEHVDAMRNAYDGTIAYLDSVLNELFVELRHRGQLDRTLVIVVSDHGEEFGEHGTFAHGLDLYSQAIHVPLFLRLPAIVPVDVIVQEPVTLRDIPATVIDLLGLRDDGLFPGRSLSRYWGDNVAKEPITNKFILSELIHAPWEPKWAPVSKGDMKSLIIRDMHYICNGDDTEEVYDFHNDPAEQNNLIQTPCGVDVTAQARDVLKQKIP